ncbi:hypothetical protein [Sulfurimonas sp.]|uniref:CiaD-like domain-containing protein n=1 Tax=Sulfurimonas sp. TaxID=2022749 RepID=UPI002621748E|nr:hypothetical protein [Sulfurimonas sp.]MCW8895115.1 hypothetical protein [Sulfurimonas sp.]MCW9067096.1 hypothetical protein [Sulfurimonas sp.]
MELKDVILSTLAEMEDVNKQNDDIKPKNNIEVKPREESSPVIQTESQVFSDTLLTEEKGSDNEMIFLNSMRERLLVLFEGFQAPNNTNIEAKVDMTLNFLEYMLVSIDTRVEELEKGHK